MSDVTDVEVKPEGKVINYNPVFPVMTAMVNLELPIDGMSLDMLKLAGDRTNHISGFTTATENINIDQFQGVPLLKEAIYGIACAFGREMKYESNYEKCSISVWANVMRKGNYTLPHGHKRTVFSGVFFASAPSNAGSIAILNPTTIYRDHEPLIAPNDTTAFTADSFGIQPSLNSLFIWPSWLQYCVPEIKSEDPLVCFFFTVDFLPPGA
jgi:uncharacterized protein (TIGR02466 family)